MRSELTFNMLNTLRMLQKADMKQWGSAMDIHFRTAEALKKRGLVHIDGCAEKQHSYNFNYCSAFLTSAGREFCTGIADE